MNFGGEKTAAYLVDASTGEIAKKIRVGDKVKVTPKESIEYLSQFQDWKIEHFYKGHIGEIRKLMQELSTPEKAFLFSIAPYVGYEDCCLKYDNGNELTFDDMVSISGLSRGSLSSVLSSLLEKDVIYKGKNSRSRQYFVNPWLFCKGNRINKVLQTMFCNYRVRVCGGKKWKDVQCYES